MGSNWHEAQQVCQHLDEDCLTLAPLAQHIWRLPSVEEASSIRVHYRPLLWTHLEPHSEAVGQFLAMLRFEQKNQTERLSEVLK